MSYPEIKKGDLIEFAPKDDLSRSWQGLKCGDLGVIVEAPNSLGVQINWFRLNETWGMWLSEIKKVSK